MLSTAGLLYGGTLLEPSGGDDTAQLTDALGTGSRTVLVPGQFNIYEPIVVPSTYGQELYGCGKQVTSIIQHTPGQPIFNMGGSGSNPFHSCAIEDLRLSYATPDATAIAMDFNAMMYESRIKGVWFDNCFYGIRCANAAFPPFWGTILDDLVFGSGISGGAMDWTGSSNAGVPNNHFRRMFVVANNMVGPIFKNLRGYNWQWDVCEIITANQGPQLLLLQQSSRLRLGSLKLENGTFTNAALSLIQGQGSYLDIGTLHFLGDSGGLTYNAAGGSLYLVNNANQMGGGFPSRTEIGFIETLFTVLAGNVYVIESPGVYSNGQARIRSAAQSGTQLVNSISTASGETLVVDDYLNHHQSQDNGNAGLAIALGMPNIQQFDTAFTAQQTITLPSNQPNMFNGLYYEMVFAAGTLTNFGALITCNGVTLYTVPATASKVVIRFTFRRSTVGVQAGWQCTKYETGLPV